jgi:hypothetical protein
MEGTKSKTEGKRTKTGKNAAQDGGLRCSLSLPTTLNVPDAPISVDRTTTLI